MPPTTSDANDVQLTATEATQLGKAFHDKYFRKLMAQYASDIADPQHKEEHAAYMAKLEAQHAVPSGKAPVQLYVLLVL